jgi:type II secretory pathway component PulC
MGAETTLKIRDLLYQESEFSMPSTAQPEPDIRKAQSKVRSKAIETYRIIWERNLFKVAEPAKKQKPPESIDVDKIAVAENNIGLKLIGTVLANDPRLNSAIINVDATRRQGVFREKESVGGFLIKGILRNSIIIENDKGQLKRLIVENADLTTIGASKASRPKPAEPREDSNPPLEITSTPAAVEIRRAEVRSALSGIQRSTAASSFSPYLFDGKPDGFYIVNPGPKGILTRIGLRTGDLVRGVEGMQLERPGDSVGFFERLLEGGEFSVLVQRGDQIQVLQLVIN